jgi:hypothetical protein
LFPALVQPLNERPEDGWVTDVMVCAQLRIGNFIQRMLSLITHHNDKGWVMQLNVEHGALNQTSRKIATVLGAKGL